MAHVHDLQVSECLKAPGPAFHAYAAPLEAAEGLARDGGLMRVDPDGPGLDRRPQGRAAVSGARPDQGTQPEMRTLAALPSLPPTPVPHHPNRPPQLLL